MLSEISQMVIEKHHMISPVSGTESTKQTSKQNITRDMEIKKKLTVTREQGEVGRGIIGERREKVTRNTYKGPMDKTKGRKDCGWEVGVGGTGENGDNCT